MALRWLVERALWDLFFGEGELGKDKTFENCVLVSI